MLRTLNCKDRENGPERLSVVDALRGFALLAIVLLHNLEHYNLYFIPDGFPDWLVTIDKWVWDVIFFFLAGNAYATFSLLFGFSFFIQMRNARKRGIDFRARFAWRMFLLACFAQLHALFYNGDILLLYAVCGMILIPASSWKDRTVAIVATILMLQPYIWGKILYAYFNPEYVDTNSIFATFAASAEEVGMKGNWMQTLVNNIGNGQLYSNMWQIEAGRLFQTPALFLFGMLLGRKEMFVKSEKSMKFWKTVLLSASILAIPLYCLKTYVPPYLSNITIISYYGVVIPRLWNFAFMSILVSLFVICWMSKGEGYKFQRFTIPYGRMSLTNYIFQSIMGVAIYYHCGLDLWNKTGATQCVIIATAIFLLQLGFSRYWLSTNKQGPFEWLWKKFTWIKFGKEHKTLQLT